MGKLNVYNKYNKKGITLRIINIILIIYIFTLGIGYSLFKESLTISGTVSTTPAEMFTWESDTVISGLTKAGVEVLKSKGGELIIPEGVTAIADSAMLGYDKGFSPYAIGKVVTGSELSLGTSVDEYDIITSVSFPSTMRRIGNYSFVNSKKLSKLSFKEGLQEIGAYAFSLNDNLSGELYIPDSVKTVGQASFSIPTSTTNKLTSISISQATSYDTSGNILGSFFGRGNLTIREPARSPLFIWESDTVISGLTDEGIAAVKANGGHLVIPEGVTEIASANFDFGNSSGSFDKGFSPFAIGKIEMSDPDFESKILQAEVNIIKRITFPSTLKKIGAGAFSFCLYLEEDLLLPTGLIEIGAGSFAMVSINSLVIPDTVTVIGAFSFQSSSVSSLKLGSSVMTVEKYAFSECNNLQGELVIPNSVKTIGEMGFGIISDSYNKINSISISKNTTFVNNGSDQDSFYNRPTPTIRD